MSHSIPEAGGGHVERVTKRDFTFTTYIYIYTKSLLGAKVICAGLRARLIVVGCQIA